jgi:hypothetical protein
MTPLELKTPDPSEKFEMSSRGGEINYTITVNINKFCFKNEYKGGVVESFQKKKIFLCVRTVYLLIIVAPSQKRLDGSIAY